MKKNISFYIDNDYLIWEDDFCIFTKEDNQNLIIEANEDGLVSLARHLITLIMNCDNYSHIHLDEFNSLEDSSCELILQKNDLNKKSNIANKEINKINKNFIEITIEYEKEINIGYEDDCYIEVSKQEEVFLIDANDIGLLALSKYLLILAQPEFKKNDFILINKNNLLTKQSYNLIIKKI